MCEYPYDQSSEIPSLRLDVEVTNAATGQSVPYRAMIDTASDLSRVPPKVQDKLKLMPTEEAIFGYGDGVDKAEKIYVAIISWNGFRIAAKLRVGPANRDYILIGRNILNQVVMHCNAPAGVFSFDEPV